MQAYEDLLRLQSVNNREVNGLLQRKVCGTCQGVERAGCELSGRAPAAESAVPRMWTNGADCPHLPSPQVSWTEADVGLFARLCQEEHRLQGQV